MKIKLTEKEVVLRHWMSHYVSDKTRDKMYVAGYRQAIKNILDKWCSDRLKRGWWGGR